MSLAEPIARRPEEVRGSGVAAAATLNSARPHTSTVDQDIRVAAAIDVPVLITGGSSTERQRYTRLIHDRARSRSGPFVALDRLDEMPTANSIALSPASARYDLCLRGAIEHARGGTLFLDHIDRLSPAGQTELLGLLEERAKGDYADGAAASVRIITGASRRFATERTIGAFSNLLFYRLNMIHIDLSLDSEGLC